MPQLARLAQSQLQRELEEGIGGIQGRLWEQEDIGSQRISREPDSWRDAIIYLLQRNLPAFCDLVCALALIVIGIMRYISFDIGTELMIASATRFCRKSD
jgi:hypothetical protein